MIETLSTLRELGDPLTVTVAITFAVFTALWALSVPRRDASIVDQYWAVGFAVIGWTIVLLTGLPAFWHLVFLCGVTLWAARLGLYLSFRHAKMDGEDPRYTEIRKSNERGFWWKSLPMIFWLQAVLMCLIATPIYAALLYPANVVALPLFAFGMAVFAAGFAIESTADYQLARFKADPANAGKLLQTGLWGYSRHPHYFGESLVWTGFGVAAFALSGAWWALTGPVLITALLLKVSGIPPLERHLSSTKDGYDAYRERVNAFIPGPPRATARQAA